MTTLLTCLRVAKTACKDFKIEEKFSAVLLTAMHHGDEQVGLQSMLWCVFVELYRKFCVLVVTSCSGVDSC